MKPPFIMGLTWALVLVSARCPVQAQAGKVLAWMDDGQFIEGQAIDGWSLQKPRPRIDGQRLFDRQRRAVVIRRLGVQPHLAPPYVRLKNGDVIPGRLTGLTKASSAPSNTHADKSNQIARLRISPRGKITTPDRKLTVSRSRLQAVIHTPEAAGALKPGMVMLGDGRRFRPQAMDWTEQGLRLLLDEGVRTVDVNRIAGLKVKPAGSAQTPMNPGMTDARRIGRILTRNGMVLTFKAGGLQVAHANARADKRAHLIQPPWSTTPIKVPLDRIIVWSYQAPDQVPLSRFPSQGHTTPGPSGYAWPWKVNRNVRGQIASVGRRSALVAIGVHGPAELRFVLPADSQSFSAWVGLDEAVGDGGRVALTIYTGPATGPTPGKPAWTSGPITGKAKAIKVGPLDLRQADSLTIKVDDLATETSPGDEPLDIRDEVSLLRPLVSVEPSN